MISIYRISSARYPVNSGTGAALYGGRWNPIGTPVIYAAQSASLAALEILVHYSVLPKDYVLTEIQMMEDISVARVEEESLPDGWDSEPALSATREIGEQWVSEGRFAVLSVPSSVIPGERNFILNPAHSEFGQIIFTQPVPFRFDPRLKK